MGLNACPSLSTGGRVDPHTQTHTQAFIQTQTHTTCKISHSHMQTHGDRQPMMICQSPTTLLPRQLSEMPKRERGPVQAKNWAMEKHVSRTNLCRVNGVKPGWLAGLG